MGTRRKSRELALQMLFQSDMGKQDAEQVRRTFWSEHETASTDVRGFADDLFRVATDRSAEIDGLIERHAEHWRMERMAAVDRNLLRAAVAELMAYPETPRAVVITCSMPSLPPTTIVPASTDMPALIGVAFPTSSIPLVTAPAPKS